MQHLKRIRPFGGKSWSRADWPEPMFSVKTSSLSPTLERLPADCRERMRKGGANVSVLMAHGGPYAVVVSRANQSSLPGLFRHSKREMVTYGIVCPATRVKIPPDSKPQMVKSDVLASLGDNF
jgi:hypothetical protein